MDENRLTYIRPAVHQALERAAEALKAGGAKTRRISDHRLRRAFGIWAGMMSSAEGPNYAKVLGGGDAIRTGRQLLRWMVGRSPHTLPALLTVLSESLPELFSGQFSELAEQGRQLQTDLEQILRPRGVILHSSYSQTAPFHGGCLLAPFDFACIAIFNVLEFPATQVPIGFDRRGLPLGVQVAAIRGKDDLTTGVAAHLEEAFGGWTLAGPKLARSWRLRFPWIKGSKLSSSYSRGPYD